MAYSQNEFSKYNNFEDTHTFVKQNKERWHTHLQLIHETGTFITYNLNFRNGIFLET